MAITKRARVSFDVKLVVTSDIEEQIVNSLRAATSNFLKMSEEERAKHLSQKKAGFGLHVIQTAATVGPEAAMEVIITDTIRETIRESLAEELKEVGLTASPAAVRWFS